MTSREKEKSTGIEQRRVTIWEVYEKEKRRQSLLSSQAHREVYFQRKLELETQPCSTTDTHGGE
jgi:hypothetical protein